MKNLIELTKETGRQNVISFGLTINGKTVVTKSILVYQNGSFHVENGGIKIACNSDSLSSLFLDTKENRRFLNLCK